MNIKQIFNTRLFIWENFTLVAGVLGYSVILYKFRFQMGDFGDFVKAGRMIWDNTNPYSHLMYVNSPVSAVIAFSISKAAPFLFVPIFWQLLNLVGLVFFTRIVVKAELHQTLPFVFSIFAFFNVTRALFGNVQVTGIVLGLIAFGVHQIRNDKNAFVSMIPIWLAAETKPQMALGFIAIFLFQEKIQKLRILALGTYVLISHGFVELMFRGDLHGLWIQKLTRYSSVSLSEGYEISYWKSLAISLNQPEIIRFLSLISITTTLLAIIAFALRNRPEFALFIAVALPFQNTYLHLYDLAFVGIIAVIGFYSYRDVSMLIGVCILLQVFPLAMETQLAVSILFVLFSIILKRKEWRLSLQLALLVIVLTIVTLTYFVFRNQSQELQIANLLVFPAALLLLLNSRKFVRVLDPDFISIRDGGARLGVAKP